MKKLMVLPLFLLATIAKSQTFDQACVNADIIFIGDISGSIKDFERERAEGLETMLEVIPPKEGSVRYGVISFSDSATIDMPLSHDSIALQNVVKQWHKIRAHGSTNLYSALFSAEYLLSKSYRKKTQVVIVVTDGDVDSDTEEETIALANSMKSKGIIILSIDVGNSDTDLVILEGISTFYIKTNMVDLSKTLKKMFPCM